MKLTLLSYDNVPTEFDIGNLEDIRRIVIDIYTGDEEAVVSYKDGTTKKYSTYNAFVKYFDGEYDAYNAGDEYNAIEDPEWLERKNSYDGYDIAEGVI